MSLEITNLFRSYQILPQHLYYYSGLQGVPDAIIGIHQNYSLRSAGWQPIDLSSSLLEKWVSRMRYVNMITPRGSRILDPGGGRVGVWFSAEHQTRVRLEKNNSVVIVAPGPPQLRGIR